MSFSFNTTNLIPASFRRLGELYHENSKIHRRASAPLGRWIGDLLENPAAVHTLAQSDKMYPGVERIALVEPTPTPSEPISEIIARRRSVVSSAPNPHFSDKPLSAPNLARLLTDAYGITGVQRSELYGVEIINELRAVPSGGALYPLEIYPLVTRSENLTPGVYHYQAKAGTLEIVQSGLDRADLEQATSYQSVLSEAAVVFVITALFGRSYFKYQDRGYRFVLLEAGHVAQNLYLVATALDLAVVAIGGFFDDQVNDLLDVDGVEEAAVYLVAIGHPPEDCP